MISSPVNPLLASMPLVFSSGVLDTRPLVSETGVCVFKSLFLDAVQVIGVDVLLGLGTVVECFVEFVEPFSETIVVFETFANSCVGYLPFPLTTA